jgi:hypothetical protein
LAVPVPLEGCGAFIVYHTETIGPDTTFGQIFLLAAIVAYNELRASGCRRLWLAVSPPRIAL